MPLLVRLAILIAGTGLAGPLFLFGKAEVETITPPYHIVVREGKLEYPLTVVGENVASALNEAGLALGPHDLVSPHPETPLTNGLRILVQRAQSVSLAVDGVESEIHTHARTVGDLLQEHGVDLGPEDRAEPPMITALTQTMHVAVIRVSEIETTERQPIPFEVGTHEDPALSWGERIVEQPGKTGIKEVRLLIQKENGVETQRTVLGTTILEYPETEIVRIGTLVRIGRREEGWASWYRFGSALTAASTTFPRKTHLKVTNRENGVSVIIQVNDYGPTIPGRVIDLNAVAFKKLAPLSRGVIPVLVEKIL